MAGERPRGAAPVLHLDPANVVFIDPARGRPPSAQVARSTHAHLSGILDVDGYQTLLME
jgi:hypothetical protein